MKVLGDKGGSITINASNIGDVISSIKSESKSDSDSNMASNENDSVESTSQNTTGVKQPKIINTKKRQKSGSIKQKAAVDMLPSSVSKDKVSAIAKSKPELSSVRLNSGKAQLTDIDITEQDRANFIDSIITGDRYKSTMSLIGGKVTVTFRSKSAEESSAVFAFMSSQITSGFVRDDKEYAQVLRSALLAAQVEELNINGKIETFPELHKPLKRSGPTEDPFGIGWADDVEFWSQRPEGFVAILSNALFEFETKYWYMVDRAEDVNFWNPAGSIEE